MARDLGTEQDRLEHLVSFEKTARSEKHISTLDGVRGVAALTVFFHHAIFTSVDDNSWPLLLRPLISLSRAGQYGVDLFFTLSGYLITSILIAGKDQDYWLKAFYVKRFTRILPIYFLTLVGLAIWLPGSADYIILSLLFIANFARYFKVDAVGPFWTLAIEEQFYIFWPWIVRSVTVRMLKRVSLGVVIAEPFIRLIAIVSGRHYFMYTMFHCDGLALGALLACQVLDRDHESQLRRSLRALAVGALLYGLYVTAVEAPIIGHAIDALAYTGIGLLAYALISFAVTIPKSKSIRWLSGAILVFFGNISYAFYMTHLYIFMGFDQLFGPLNRASPSYIFVRLITVLFATSALCFVLRHCIELPAMELRDKLLGRSHATHRRFPR